MAEARELILKLGQKITDRIGVKVTTEDPEYWGLACVITDEMAEVALAMKVRVPATAQWIAKRCKKSVERTEELLQEMSVIGLIEYNWENEDHHKQYVLPMFVPGCAEFMMMNAKQVEEHPELADFFEQMARLPLEKVTPMVPQGGAGIGMHVIPVEKAIPSSQESASIEHISYWLNKYKDKYAVGACSCRRQQRVRGEGTGDLEDDLCIGVGDMADYLVETGKGRYIDYDEVMEILQRAEDNGYVHQITNIDSEEKIFAICNCAIGVCNGLRTSQLFNTPNMSRSAYRASVTKENCVACGRCVEYCPSGAARLGQKLCTKNGEIEYPVQELPDETKWGRDKWSVDYRDKNQINCYDTGTAPCKASCPAHLPVQGYIKMASQGKYLDALKLIKTENPFPAVCGAICNRRCEDACTRGRVDQAVAIDEIKKFIAEQELHAKTRYIPPMLNYSGKPFQEKIAVIGAGPAGMSAAFYLKKMGYPVTVFEKEKRPGGMLMNGIPSFRLEKDVIEAEIDVLREMGVEFRCGVEVGRDITVQKLRQDGYKAFYVAIGAQDGRKAGIPGEDAKGVLTGLEFLRCVNQDMENTRIAGRTVVIGGGNVAVDVARTALRAGASSVSMYCLETRETMPAAGDEIEEAAQEGIGICNSWGPKEILTENGRVTGVVFKKCVSVFDESGRFHPVYDEEQLLTVECEAVLVAIGQSVRWGELLAGTKAEFNRNGTVKADPVTYQTAEPDIFVGGDVYTGPKFAIDAIAAGKEGCVSIHRFVHPGQSLTIGRNLRQFSELDKDNLQLDPETFDNAKRQVPGRKSPDGNNNFRDLRSTFTEEQVRAEAGRCLGCGATVVDPNKCIGCGVCTTKCEFDAIHLSRDLPEASRMYKAEDKMKAILPYMLKREIRIIRKGKKG
ncbi:MULTISPECIES: FAD-dependent oxidoreductase [Eisenbergiella]|uniref:Pyridine nucleotide-disulfide oxidoreductase n=1 Tax=Eisenbergiella massiliensis TaxID=1720294 RepID=A0A3E3IEI3_9FIRM|nr:FAD-dependent oxidoreductase [Eisenbergiella massiliensis]RGE62590.1 pyridine nucleotide-disulfide oxidoreductase [Eisenbergiella massiliensis]RGE65391.1 pyridine nucleotide-disulfide oxidoreductase [Eisenbergiella massiliensis]